MGPIKNGGVGSACYLLAKKLAKNHHQVTIFLSGKQFFLNASLVYWRMFYQELGITIELIRENEIPLQHGNFHARESMDIYLLLRDSDFNLILFQDMHALGHYCLLAKRSGLEFQNTQLWVMFHGPSNWHLQASNGLPSNTQQLALHVMEKECCLNADRLLFATKHAQQIAYAQGYATKEQLSSVELFPFEAPLKRIKHRSIWADEICFFGRLETRKGLETFLAAVERLIPFLIEKQIKVSLLGRSGIIDGADAQEYIDKWVAKNRFHLNILLNKNREESIQYLIESNALAVLASMDETMGYTLIECLQHSIPFVCSDIEPYREICGQFRAKGVLTFKVGNSLDLAKKISSALRGRIRPTICESKAADLNSDRWKNLIELAKPKKPQLVKKPFSKPRISLCIPHRNHADYFGGILESFASLKELPVEVIVYDDASDNENLLRLKRKLKQHAMLNIPIQIIYGKKQIGVSAARNILARAATGDYIYFLDADNLPTKDLFLDLGVMIQKNEPDLIASSLCRFDSSTGVLNSRALDITKKELYFFISNDLSLNFFQNMVGDANFCVRKEFFLRIGGFNEGLSSSEDHEFFVRSTLNGAKYLNCPRALIFYRVHDSNASSIHDAHQSLTAVRNTFVGNLIHPGMQEMMKMVTAWAYSREAILARGGAIPPNTKLPKVLPILPLNSDDIVRLRQLQKKFSNKSKLGLCSLQLKSSRRLGPATQVDSSSEIVDILIISPKSISIELLRDRPKVKIERGLNRIQISVPKRGKLTICTPGDEVDLFVLHSKPWLGNPFVMYLGQSV